MADPDVPALRFGVLGPLRVWQGETVVDLGPLQQRVILAVLLLLFHAGRPVGREQMINAVWGDAPPRHAVNLVQRHISGLRRVLMLSRPGPGASFRLEWTDAGYLLTIPDGSLDIQVFETELNRARAARAAGHMREATEALHSALGLWRGPVCEGLYSPFLDTQRDRLAERRISVLEERVELDLATGDDADLIAELRDLIAEYPLRERLYGLLMLALYRAGRQADALGAFRDARRKLHEELGVEPGAPLQRLHQQILAADPKLATAVSAEVTVNASSMASLPRPVPAQLPHPVPDFSGRDAELKRLDALVASDGGETEKAVVITAISGTAGVGKTALAVHWAHQMGERFPGGQLYVNLRGFDPTGSAMEPAEAIRGFLDAFGISPHQIPTRLEAQTALYRSLLAGRRVLVLLDNAGDADQVRPLLPGSPGCMVIVTSRNELSGLIVAERAHPVVLDLLSLFEARELLSRRLGESRVLTERSAADDIIALCSRLPLALTIVAARAATHPEFRLSTLAAELREAKGGLDAFEGEDQATNIRAVFSWSYQRLSVPSRQLFRLLGLHPGRDISIPTVASLAGISKPQARSRLAELARAHLVTERIPGRFTFHDLLRAYATGLAHTHDSGGYRIAAMRRMLDHYLHTAYFADKLLNQHRDVPFTLPPVSSGVTPEILSDKKHALAWFEAEHAVLLAVLSGLEGSAGSGTDFDPLIWQLAWALASFFEYRGHWRDWRNSENIALDASRRLSDRSAQALSHRLLARSSTRLSTYDDAFTHLQQALDLYRELDDKTGQAASYRDLAWVLEQQGLHQEALPHALRALALFEAAGHQSGQGRSLHAVGWFHARLGDYQQALIRCQQALDLQQEIGDRFGQAETWDSLGYAHHHLGHHQEAISCYQQSINLYREFGDRYNEADTLTYLGDAHHAIGDFKSARITWQSALKILEQLGHPDAIKVRAKLGELSEQLPGGHIEHSIRNALVRLPGRERRGSPVRARHARMGSSRIEADKPRLRQPQTLGITAV